MASSTSAYYEHHAQQFFDDTIAVDMSPLYARFLRWVPKKGSILDAGCGSGRDMLAFHKLGYEVTAFDASPMLADLAANYCGFPVAVMRFQDIQWQEQFDGIWACASLLHVPAVELPDVLMRMATALRPQGVLYASFKYGQGERDHYGRRFTDLDETGLAALLQEVQGLKEIQTWITTDVRPGRATESWLNTLLVATPRPCRST
ncbi:MAG TPA: class I SAM-dependent methyltransferase [Lamprocystis sp. (in: g-proteobacteria)]|nr:class I SAM-dependent methyltransferase [Lamprocystis sp. (in: g-proteobacteria)]